MMADKHFGLQRQGAICLNLLEAIVALVSVVRSSVQILGRSQWVFCSSRVWLGISLAEVVGVLRTPSKSVVVAVAVVARPGHPSLSCPELVPELF